MLSFKVLALYKHRLVFFEYHIRKCLSHFGVYGVGNILKFIIGSLAAGHCYKKSVLTLDYFYIMYYCATETEESYTSVMINAVTPEGHAYSVGITLDPTETGNMIMMMYADMSEGYNIVNAAWGYIDANSFTDKSEIFCRYDDMLQAFAAMVRGEKENPYSCDYELSLYRTLLKCCGV